MSEPLETRYKETVLLPVTDFPMRGNLPENEPIVIENWTKNNLYQKIIEKNKDRQKYVMPDGPPYANGNLHIGHVLNKVLKDIVIKYKNMKGYRAEFIPGWDCHGLPIELGVTKKLGSKKNELTKKELRQLCREEAAKWIEAQKAQFVRLGALGEWENPYHTMDPKYEAQEIRVLSKIFRNGNLYRGEKPVYWCTALQTALAAAEVEYHDHKSPSVYVKFEVLEKEGPLKAIKEKLSFVIWTTTPWTLPANYGIALNSEFEYGLYPLDSEVIIIAKELKEAFEKDTEKNLGEPLAVYKGKEFENMKATHPFMGRDSLVILGDHVSLEGGTGCVHTAPGHGPDDYHIGLKYKLPVRSPVDPAGRFTDEVPQYQGIKIWDANPKIVEDLVNSGHMIAHKEITHSYPHNPRSKTPLIFRATPQWFIEMDGDFKLREKALAITEKDIQFFPAWGRPRLTSMISNSPDWCVSRQRTWGVPIPVFYCESCGEPLAHADVMDKVADKMESTNTGIEAYFDTPTKEFTEGHTCKKCGSSEFKHGEDILDVWFDSGVCHTAVQMSREGLGFPADIYLEGSDQHRGWFQTSLLSSVAAYEKPPFKALITHGFVNDAQGYKMSKSKGNVIDPAVVSKKYGAEILRLWVAYEDYGQDVSVSEEMFKRVSETYRRIRNTMRFLLGNLNDFDHKKDLVAASEMPALDQWTLSRLNAVIRSTTQAYDNYNFFKIYHALNMFFTVELSSFYLDLLKDRLYTGRKDGLARRSSQTVFYHLLQNLTGLMAPVLSFLADEVHKFIPGEEPESVFLKDFPEPNPEWDKPELEKEFTLILEVRELVQKDLEELRRSKAIGSSLDAKVKVTCEGDTYSVMSKYKNELRELFIVSQVEINQGKLAIEVKKADGEKCVRCWHYSTEIGKETGFPGICPKCVEALK